jgi:non-ribosomal peptide synthetase component F
LDEQDVTELRPPSGESGAELVIFDAAMLEARRYWRERLADLDLARAQAPLPDFPRRTTDSRQWAAVTTELPTPLAARLGRLTGDGPFLMLVVITAAAMLCLSRYGGGEDIVVGSPPRRQADDLDQSANALAIRGRLAPELSFKQLLGDVRAALLGAYAHQQYPFARLLADLGHAPPGERSGQCPVFDLVVTLDGLHGRLATTGHDLTLAVAHRAGAVSWTLAYDAGLFSRGTMERFSHHLVHLLDGATAAPDRAIGELSGLDAAERRQLGTVWSHGGPATPGLPPVHVQFAQQAANTSDTVAIAERDPSAPTGSGTICADEASVWARMSAS